MRDAPFFYDREYFDLIDETADDFPAWMPGWAPPHRAGVATGHAPAGDAKASPRVTRPTTVASVTPATGATRPPEAQSCSPNSSLGSASGGPALRPATVEVDEDTVAGLAPPFRMRAGLHLHGFAECHPAEMAAARVDGRLLCDSCQHPDLP